MSVDREYELEKSVYFTSGSLTTEHSDEKLSDNQSQPIFSYDDSIDVHKVEDEGEAEDENVEVLESVDQNLEANANNDKEDKLDAKAFQAKL